jgi:hypothetical protein
MSSGPVFQLLKRSIAKLNPKLAALIPDNIPAAKVFNALDPSVALLRNQTLTKLQTSGTCINDVQRTEEGSLVVKRNVKKGQLVTTSPLFVMKLTTFDADEECTVSPLSCFEHEKIPVTFCSLTASVVERVESDNVANVEYRWRDERAVRELAIDDLSLRSSSALVWDAVALRNIKVGEKVRASVRV